MGKSLLAYPPGSFILVTASPFTKIKILPNLPRMESTRLPYLSTQKRFPTFFTIYARNYTIQKCIFQTKVRPTALSRNYFSHSKAMRIAKSNQSEVMFLDVKVGANNYRAALGEFLIMVVLVHEPPPNTRTLRYNDLK
jgi:hypothetical protein